MTLMSITCDSEILEIKRFNENARNENGDLIKIPIETKYLDDSC